MDAKDLMIGDWVNFLVDTAGGETREDPMTNEYQPMKIVSLSSWYNNDGEVESAEGVINDIDQIEPIPLTPEILEKNGWFPLDEYRYEGDIALAKGRNYFRLKNTTICINSVHELQHALRLCGINKEIII